MSHLHPDCYSSPPSSSSSLLATFLIHSLILISTTTMILTVTTSFLQKNPQATVKNNWDSLLLLLQSCFSRVRLCATPKMAAHQALLSLGFSRQEHWSGLPFPSPMHESEKWKWSHSVVSMTPWTAAYQAPLSMGFSRQEHWSGLPLSSPETL